jgi:Ankyrin repeats (many copies)
MTPQLFRTSHQGFDEERMNTNALPPYASAVATTSFLRGSAAAVANGESAGEWVNVVLHRSNPTALWGIGFSLFHHHYGMKSTADLHSARILIVGHYQHELAQPAGSQHVPLPAECFSNVNHPSPAAWCVPVLKGNTTLASPWNPFQQQVALWTLILQHRQLPSANLRVGDWILAIQGTPLGQFSPPTLACITNYVRSYSDSTLRLLVYRPKQREVPQQWKATARQDALTGIQQQRFSADRCDYYVQCCTAYRAFQYYRDYFLQQPPRPIRPELLYPPPTFPTLSIGFSPPTTNFHGGPCASVVTPPTPVRIPSSVTGKKRANDGAPHESYKRAKCLFPPSRSDASVSHRNELFGNIPFDDDGIDRELALGWDMDVDRTSLFVAQSGRFGQWLQNRKSKWRADHGTWRIISLCAVPNEFLFSQRIKHMGVAVVGQSSPQPGRDVSDGSRNPLFTNATTGKNLAFCDNRSWDDENYDPDEGNRFNALFFAPIPLSPPEGFVQDWLRVRQAQWRKKWGVNLRTAEIDANCRAHGSFIQSRLCDASSEAGELHAHCPDLIERWILNDVVRVDYWTHQGYPTWDNWLSFSKHRWRSRYSWRHKERRTLKQVCTMQVSLHTNDFDVWLNARRSQWRLQRRQRLRQNLSDDQQHHADVELDQVGRRSATTEGLDDFESPRTNLPLCGQPLPSNAELELLDELLQEQENESRRQMEARRSRKPLDLLLIFDSALGCPDDVVVHLLQYFPSTEYGRLLALNRKLRAALSSRDGVWKRLCPSHWTLPRRPRKPWHVLFLSRLREDTLAKTKRCDDLLLSAVSILFKGDNLHQLEKVVTAAENEGRFDVNYCSGVVCERNSLLNLAVIYQRHKVVKWLVETKGADIESSDRGHFTPLLNAAWAGDRYLVRFLMQRGSNRNQVGTCHYTKPLASLDFKGHTADGWAEKRGHHDIALLIRSGL